MEKVKIVSVGVCPNCQREFVRPSECTHAACNCQSARLISLDPALILPPKMQKRVENLAKSVNVSVETLVNAVLERAIEEYRKGKIAVSV